MEWRKKMQKNWENYKMKCERGTCHICVILLMKIVTSFIINLNNCYKRITNFPNLRERMTSLEEIQVIQILMEVLWKNLILAGCFSKIEVRLKGNVALKELIAWVKMLKMTKLISLSSKWDMNVFMIMLEHFLHTRPRL